MLPMRRITFVGSSLVAILMALTACNSEATNYEKVVSPTPGAESSEPSAKSTRGAGGQLNTKSVKGRVKSSPEPQ